MFSTSSTTKFVGMLALVLLLTPILNTSSAQDTERGWEPVVSEAQQRSYNGNQYAPLVRIGDTLIASGVIGLARGQDNSADAQFRRAFDRIIDILDDHGLDMGDVAEITTYHVNIGELGRDFMRVKQEYFPEAPFPAWTAIGVDALFLEPALIEIRFTAALRPGSD